MSTCSYVCFYYTPILDIVKLFHKNIAQNYYGNDKYLFNAMQAGYDNPACMTNSKIVMQLFSFSYNFPL